MTSQHPTVVIGGGILGVSTAVNLARRGARVTLVTEGRIASGASGRSLSWLNSLMVPDPAYHALRIAGVERYRRFAAEHSGTERFLRFDGNIFWPGPGEKSLDEVAAGLDGYGYGYELLSPGETVRKGLGLNPDVLPDQILYSDHEGWVDLESIISVLLEEFLDAGGELLTEVGRARVEVEGDHVVAVVLADGSRLPTDRVMLATGPSVPAVVRDVGFDIPDQTPISVLVRTKPIDVTLKAVINSPRVALRPNVNGNLVLDRSWAEASVTGHDVDTYAIPEETIQQLLWEASQVLEGTPHLEHASHGIGPKPIPGDGVSVVGELPGISGYHVAFTHSGATLGLVLGEMGAEGMLGEPNPMLATFGPGRFAQR